MATSYNKRSPQDSGNAADLPLILGVGAFIVACFFVGYFVLGGKKVGGTGSAPPTDAAGMPTMIRTNTAPSPKGVLTVVDNTAAMEEKRKKAEEEAQKKAEEEAAKKLEDDARKLAEKEAAENTASPSPTATATPDPGDLPESVTPDEPSPTPTPTPEPTPTPVPTPTPKPLPTPKPSPTPKPKPSPTPVPNTPDDPEDRAMSQVPPVTNAAPTKLYRVRVGTYESRENADTRVADLKASGFEASLATDVSDGKIIYRVQVGAYKSEKTAKEFAKEVEAKGFKTTISRN